MTSSKPKYSKGDFVIFTTFRKNKIVRITEIRRESRKWRYDIIYLDGTVIWHDSPIDEWYSDDLEEITRPLTEEDKACLL